MPVNPSKLDTMRDALKLDLATFVLDMVGIVDPTGAADVASGMISLWRGDWLSAGISFLGVFAGLGDLAKVGKLRKYAESVENAIALARRDPRFAKEVYNHLKGLKGVFNRLPMDKLPSDIRGLVQRVRFQIDNFVTEVPAPKLVREVKPSKEVVVVSQSLETARNKAIDWLESKGAVFGPHIQPIPGKLYEKRTGKRISVGVESTQGPKWELRIDFEPDKGAHFNAKFAPQGAPKHDERMAYTFPTPPGVKTEEWMKKLMEKLGNTAKRPLPKK